MRIAICSGSFDPITLGHLDIIRRAAACFDEVWVCVVPNAEKKNQMFTPAQKLQLVNAAIAELENVKAELWQGLLAEFAVNHQAGFIVRGIRSAGDLDIEMQLARINAGLRAGLETLLLPAAAEYEHFSSSMAREMIRYHQPLEKYLPAAAAALVREMRQEKREEA